MGNLLLNYLPKLKHNLYATQCHVDTVVQWSLTCVFVNANS